MRIVNCFIIVFFNNIVLRALEKETAPKLVAEN